MKEARRDFRFVVTVVVSMLVASLLANQAGAAITPIGDFDPAYDGFSDPWNIVGDLKIGITSDGSMAISSGSTVADSNGYVGYNWGGAGTVTVTGANSLWDSSNLLCVGYFSDGNMLISNGGRVDSMLGSIGNGGYSTGAVTVTGPNSLWDNGKGLSIGLYGDGNMVIAAGGKVSLHNGSSDIGVYTTGLGSVTVTGQNSLWENPEDLYVGKAGSGNLTISYGGKVTDRHSYIGYESDGAGTATLTGSGSLWENSGDLYVGYAGDAYMVISNGGRVTNSLGYIGYDPSGIGHVTVTDSGSLWQNTSDLYVGRSGAGWLEISDGGTASVTNSAGYLAYDRSSYGLATVSGDNSLWQNSGNLYVGYGGDADMVISDGGHVTNSFGYIGYDPNGAGRVTVTGSGSVWENGAGLNIGYRSDGELIISNGGKVIDSYGWIGVWGGEITDGNGLVTPDAKGWVTVSGSGSLWENSTSVFVGHFGEGELTVADGGTVVSSDGLVGCSDVDWYTGLSGPNDISWSEAPSSIGRATITGSGSLWQNLDEFSVGRNGGEGQLVVSDGAMLTSSRGFVGCFDPEFVALAELGYIPWTGDANSIGQVAVTGPNSLWVTGSLFVGGWGGQGQLTISDTGRVITPFSLIGGFGSSSLGLLDPNYAGLGIDVESVGYATVAGPNSVLDSSNALFVGALGGQGELTIYGSARVTSSYGLIGGFDAALVGADPNDYPIGIDANSVGLVTVAGPNSLWENSDDLYVGGSSTGPGGTGLLNISSGGLVRADQVTVWGTGTIGGDATLAAPTVHNFGTFAPGNSIGTLTIDGNVTMEPNSILEVDIDNSGNSDKLTVTGDVAIKGGTVKAISTETITGWHHYNIMEANSITGAFDTLDTALLHMGIVDPLTQLSYEIDSVLLKIVASHFDDPNIAHTDNQRAVGSALQRIAYGGGNSITTAVQGLSSNEQVRAAYDDLCGSPRPPLSPITVADTTKFMGTVSNRMHCARTGVSYGTSSGPLFAMARPDSALGSGRTYDVSPSDYLFAIGNGSQHFGDQNWGIWGKAYGLYGDRENESGVRGYVYKLWGWSVGHDYWLTDELLLGVTGGFSDGYVDYVATSGRSDVDSKHIGFYSSYNNDGWYLDSVLTYGRVAYKTERSVGLMGEQLEADFDGRQISGYLEAGFDWYASGGWLVQPLASFQVSHLDVDGYTETGGASALGYDDQTFRSYKASLGMKVAEEVATGVDGLSAGVEVRVRWVHEFGDVTSSMDAHLASSPGTGFTVTDGDASRDSAVLGLGYHAELSKQMRLYFDYDASVSGENVIHVVSGALEYRW